ncbi:hypothetical protein QYM36_005745 [Artemia franciscana]|uniref:Uncharacterized protein n=1 Tax=Artemia franciscana TaxID=6661 RepID=A0AA88L4H6_ARTSF|nr:hypothetical protein QYM36_005745 [Artemia franciscana]
MSYSIYADDSLRNHDEKWLKKYQMKKIFQTMDKDTNTSEGDDLLLRTTILNSPGYETVYAPSEISNIDTENKFKSPGRNNVMLEACDAIGQDNDDLNMGNMLPPYTAHSPRFQAFDTYNQMASVYAGNGKRDVPFKCSDRSSKVLKQSNLSPSLSYFQECKSSRTPMTTLDPEHAVQDEKWLKRAQVMEVCKTTDKDIGPLKGEDPLLTSPRNFPEFGIFYPLSEILNMDTENAVLDYLPKSPSRSNMILDACEAIDKDNDVPNVGNTFPPYTTSSSRYRAFDISNQTGSVYAGNGTNDLPFQCSDRNSVVLEEKILSPFLSYFEECKSSGTPMPTLDSECVVQDEPLNLSGPVFINKIKDECYSPSFQLIIVTEQDI